MLAREYRGAAVAAILALSLIACSEDASPPPSWGALALDLLPTDPCRLSVGLVVDELSSADAVNAARLACVQDRGREDKCRRDAFSFQGCVAIVYGEDFLTCRVFIGTDDSKESWARSEASADCRGYYGHGFPPRGCSHPISGCTTGARSAVSILSEGGSRTKPFPKAATGETGATDPLTTTSGKGEAQTLAFFPAAGNARGWQGFMRVSNHSEAHGEVEIRAIDDAGRDFGTVTLALDARQTTHISSSDLEDGNAAKGLTGRIGAPGQGDWRLELSSDVRMEALAYIRTPDGLLTAMHDVAPPVEQGTNTYRVVTIYPGSNHLQESSLRLVNPGNAAAMVSIGGVDDRGRSAGPVRLEVAARAARTVSALELEEGGGGLDGALGAGDGKWRLVVKSDAPLLVMNLLTSPTGHLTNLSVGD